MTDRPAVTRHREARAHARPATVSAPERALEPEFVGKTFDDFLLRPRKGVVETRREVTLRCRLSRTLSLDLPVVSANMDSVTGGAMASALALEGGIGFVHRGMS